MNIKRSYFKLLMASATVGLFLANCTVKNSTDESCEKGDKDTGCDCPGSLTGYQVCNSDGVFGECICPDDNSNAGTGNTSTAGKNSSGGTDGEGGETTSTGGKTTTAGTDSGGGVAPVTGGAGGEGGAAPINFVPTDPNNCEECLDALCKAEYDACVDDTSCFDQYLEIIDCIDKERETGLVKRDAVRACGTSIGATSSGNVSAIWPPPPMRPAMTDLLNCLATSASDPKGPNPDWANDPNNFPAAGPTPWPEDSCAKFSCTAKFQL